MNLTATGVVILALAATTLAFRPELLCACVVFFAPFSATAVINLSSVGYKSGGVGIIAASIFFAFYLAQRCITFRVFAPRHLPTEHLLQVLLLGLFAAFCVVTLILNGVQNEIHPAEITQTFYLLFGILVTVAFSFEFVSGSSIERAVTAFRLAAIFVSLWGLLQMACFQLGVPYPSGIFNNSMSDYADMFEQRVGETTRIASVAVEPSFMAASLANFVAFGASAMAADPRLRNGRWIVAVSLTTLVLVLSNSSTAYNGLAVLAVLLAAQRPAFGFKWGAVLAAAFAGFVTLSPTFRDALWTATLGKSDTSSYGGRMAGVLWSWEMFKRQPLIGAGWGSGSTDSLVTTLLANTGVFGSALFVGSLASTLLACGEAGRARASGRSARFAAYTIGVRNALIVAMACAVTSGLKYVVLDLWWLWALGIGVASRIRLDQELGGQQAASKSVGGTPDLWVSEA